MSAAAPTSRQALEELLAGGWGFHGWTSEDVIEIGLGSEVLEFIVERLRPGDRTLETGSGYSTVAFALAGARHTAVSPVPWEHERIREWCAERGVSLDDVSIVEGFSQDVLPTLGDEPLDLVLIDGDHSFPIAFVDFYYAASRLRPGGVLIIDDTQIRTGALLSEFLDSEKGRWRLERRWGTTDAFVKLGDVVIEIGGWMSQPFCAELRLPHDAPLRARLRHRVRLRTRIRNLARRLRRPGGGAT